MKTSILVPVLNEENNLPDLFKVLSPLAKEGEILLVDNGSDDSSLELLQKFQKQSKNIKFFQEPRRGFAEPLNKALANASGELLLFLDADCLPQKNWREEMILAAQKTDIVVGETLSLPSKTIYGKLAAKLFQNHSRRTAQAKGHALPWGPTCNLAVKKSLFESVGPFSLEAAGAFDIDWCWRAVLAGASLGFAPKALVKHRRKDSKETLLRQFDRFGQSEAWLHRTYSYLLGGEETKDPLLAGVEAFERLKRGTLAASNQSLARPLEEIAAAFGSGVRLGYERPHRSCALERTIPTQAVSWWSGPREKTLFVAGKGVTTLKGKPLQLWLAKESGMDPKGLEKLVQKLFSASGHEAHLVLEDFLRDLTP